MVSQQVSRGGGLGPKLEAPKAGSDIVRRDERVRHLCAVKGVHLILLHAPSGFGKTVVMTQIAAEFLANGVATAWLTLDAADNDASRMIAGVQAALDRVSHETSNGTGAENDGAAIVDLLERVADLTEPFALFLDDFEVLHEDVVLTLVSRLIQTLPAQGRVVIGSRSLPDLPVARLRASGEMLELDARALRFTREEASTFLSKARGIDLTEADVTLLHAKTEGWPVALRLASIVLADSSDPSGFVQDFSGSDRLVSDYLAENILATQDTLVSRFLLRTSILHTLEPELCEALVPGCNAAELLEELASANVLLNRIDGPRPVYRFHALFAAYLRARLLREEPQALPHLHEAAMEWYLDNGRPVPAIDHGIEAGATDRILKLVAEVGQVCLEQGRIRLLTRWFDALPQNRVAQVPELSLMKAWAYCFTRGPGEAANVLDACGLEDQPGATGAEALSIRTMIRAMSDDFVGAAEVGRVALGQSHTASRYSRTVLANCMANVFSVLGSPDAALENLDEARAEMEGPDDAFNTMYSESVQGLIDLQENRFREAKARFRLAATARRSDDRRRINGNAWAGVPLACALYEEGAQEEAEHLLQVFLPILRDVALPDHLILSHVTLSRIAFGNGQVDHAFRYLAELEQIGQRRRLARVIAGARLERSRLYLRQGNLSAARHQLDRVGHGALWDDIRDLRLPANDLETLEITRARVLLVDGRAREALAILDDELAAAGPRQRRRRMLVLDLLRAAALLRMGETGRARDMAGEPLRTAAREGYRRIILDEGEAVAALVRAWAGPALAGDLPRREPVFAEWLQAMVDAIGPGVSTIADGRAIEASLDPLTKKELQVLRLLSEGYSNAAMSEKLFVSDSTVRTHLRNINSKLDTSSRTQAVAAARQLGIIG